MTERYTDVVFDATIETAWCWRLTAGTELFPAAGDSAAFDRGRRGEVGIETGERHLLILALPIACARDTAVTLVSTLRPRPQSPGTPDRRRSSNTSDEVNLTINTVTSRRRYELRKPQRLKRHRPRAHDDPSPAIDPGAVFRDPSCTAADQRRAAITAPPPIPAMFHPRCSDVGDLGDTDNNGRARAAER